MMHGTGAGHFITIIDENNLPFNIIIVANTTVHGRGFIRHFAHCPQVYSGLEDRIWSVKSDI